MNGVLKLTVILLLLTPMIGLWATTPIKVKTQEQFDKVVERINKGEEFHIRLSEKTYLLKTNIKATAPLFIDGCGATIKCITNIYDKVFCYKETDDFYVYKKDVSIRAFPLFFNTDGSLIKVSETVNHKYDVNIVNDEIIAEEGINAGAIVKIPIADNLKHLRNRSFDNSFGYIDCGWQVVDFLLQKADSDYFYCTILNNCRPGNLSFDRKAYNKSIRYVLYNVEKEKRCIYYDSNYVYIPKSNKTVYHLNCGNYNEVQPNIIITSDFSIRNTTLYGFSGVEIQSKTSATCDIRNCKYVYSLGCALKIVREQDETILEATVKDCEFYCCSVLTGHIIDLISPLDNNRHINFSRCIVARYSDGRASYKNSNVGISVNGNVKLNDNLLYNIPRCHLSCGKGNITAQNNVIYNTDDFNLRSYRNLSSDLGLIYCNHLYDETDKALGNIQNKIKLVGNLLYGAYAYGGDARGIFIDDGRGDVECIENIILNTQLYSMDSRNSSITEAASVRNKYEGNIVTTRYRLAGGKAVEGENKPMVNANLLISTQNNERVNIQEVAKDKRLEIDTSCYCSGGKIMVSNDLYRMLKSCRAWKEVGKYVGKIR